MSQEGIKKGVLGCCVRNKEGIPKAILLNEEALKVENENERKVTYYHEAIHAKRHKRN